MLRPSARLAAFACILVSAAPALAQVYKCPGAGGTVYQNAPCTGAPKAAPYIAKPAEPAGRQGPGITAQVLPQATLQAMDPHEIARMLTTNHQDMQRVNDEYLASVRSLRSGKPGADRASQFEALGARRNVQMRQIEASNRQLEEELQRRCPGGSRIDGRVAECRK